jgi:Membrane bound O-acyl transferase family
VAPILAFLQPILLWLPAFALICATNLFVALRRAPLGRWRWLVAAGVAMAPGLTPGLGTYSPLGWGVLTTVATTLAITTAARLPDLDHLLRVQERDRFRLFIWMSLPVARLAPVSGTSREVNRRALRYLLLAGTKRLIWELIALSLPLLPAAEIPWPLKCAVLMLYFVLNLTAASDLFSALCLWIGSDVDELFDAPLLSTSPRDFWSRRWNKFINKFALKHVALPLRKKAPPTAVIFAVFATSGLFHEYFAWGIAGTEAVFGSMMLFFLIQGALVWVGTRISLPKMPKGLGIALTFAWMMATAPLFFRAVAPALEAFGYPVAWLPF